MKTPGYIFLLLCNYLPLPSPPRTQGGNGFSPRRSVLPLQAGGARGGLAVTLLFCMALLVSACEQAEMHSVYLANNQEALYLPYQNDERPVRFDVAPGTPARAIATNLREAGLIGDTRLFEAYVRANNIAQRLEAGTYLLSPSMTMVEIVEALQNSRAQGIVVTIPEGWRLEQTADYLSEAEIVDGDEYRSMALSGELGDLDTSRLEFLNTRPAGASLEGYLFPDTYELPPVGATAAEFPGGIEILQAERGAIGPAFDGP